MKRTQSSSPAPMTKVAMRRTTRLRFKPKNSAARRETFITTSLSIEGRGRVYPPLHELQMEYPRKSRLFNNEEGSYRAGLLLRLALWNSHGGDWGLHSQPARTALTLRPCARLG